MFIAVIIVCAIFLLAATQVAMEAEYRRGYDEGRVDGFNEGVAECCCGCSGHSIDDLVRIIEGDMADTSGVSEFQRGTIGGV